MLLTRRRVADALTTTASADAQKIDAVLAGLESHREMQSPEKLGQLGELCVALSAQWSKMEEDASASDGDAESNRTAMGLGSATELMDGRWA